MVNIKEYVKIANHMCCHRYDENRDSIRYDQENNLCTCTKCGAVFYTYGPDQLNEIKKSTGVLIDVAQTLKMINPEYAESCAVLIEILSTLPDDLVYSDAKLKSKQMTANYFNPNSALNSFKNVLDMMNLDKDTLKSTVKDK